MALWRSATGFLSVGEARQYCLINELCFPVGPCISTAPHSLTQQTAQQMYVSFCSRRIIHGAKTIASYPRSCAQQPLCLIAAINKRKENYEFNSDLLLTVAQTEIEINSRI